MNATLLPPLLAPSHGRSGAPTKRDQVWRRAVIEKTRAIASERIAAVFAAGPREDAMALAVGYIDRRRGESSHHAQLDAMCHLLAVLERGENGLDVGTARHLLAVGRAILAEQPIDPRTSRVAFLWGDLERAAAALARRTRDAWSAAWHDALADLSGAERPQDELAVASELALLAGDAPSLVSRLLSREVSDLTSRVELVAVRARLLRLSGRTEAARELLLAENTGFEPALEWELARLEAAETGSLRSMARVLKLRRAIATAANQFEFWLWSRAVRARSWRGEALKLSTLRKKLSSDSVAVTIAAAIDEMTQRSSRPLARLQRLGRALRDSGEVETIERELLLWAAAARSLVGAKQPSFARVAAERYRGLSRIASASRTSDVLGLAATLPSLGTGPSRSWAELELSARFRRVPTRARERYAACGQAAFDVLRSRLRHVGRGDDAWRTEALSLVTDHLSHLKGPLMKLGQLLSHYGMGLGPEERLALASLYDDAVGIPFDEIRAVLESELDLATHFAEFEPTPFAAGSIGQVHRGRLHDGREVAVKVQYPGVETALAADMRVLSALAPLLDRLVPNWDVAGLLGEMRDLLVAECDYRQEARNQCHMASLWSGDGAIVVPPVIAACSGRRVLTMEHSSGVRLSDFSRQASASERTRAGEQIARFIVRSAFIERTFHTDPHPGNFLILPTAVCVVDFGSVKYWRGDEGLQWREVLLACVEGDAAGLERAFTRMNMVHGAVDFELAIAELQRFTMKWTTQEAPTAFGIDDVAGEISSWLRNPALRNIVIQPVDLYGFRMYWGAFALLAMLGAPIDLASIVRRELAAN